MKYYCPVELEDGSVLSCDMVRLKVHFGSIKDAQVFGQKLLDDLAWDAVDFYESVNGLYRYMWVPQVGGESFKFGLGLQQPGKKLNTKVGFVEFNPNKLGGFELFQTWFDRLRISCTWADLVRWDLAQDFPVSRELIRLSKGRATYTYTLYDSLTEYSGRHNSAGFVKVYDKAAEQGLSVPLTRCEMTCDGSWDAEKICASAPVLYGRTLPDWSSEDMQPQTRALVGALALLQEADLPCEHLIALLDKRKKKEVKDFLRGSPLALYPLLAVIVLLDSVKSKWTI